MHSLKTLKFSSRFTVPWGLHQRQGLLCTTIRRLKKLFLLKVMRDIKCNATSTESELVRKICASSNERRIMKWEIYLLVKQMKSVTSRSQPRAMWKKMRKCWNHVCFFQQVEVLVCFSVLRWKIVCLSKSNTTEFCWQILTRNLIIWLMSKIRQLGCW